MKTLLILVAILSGNVQYIPQRDLFDCKVAADRINATRPHIAVAYCVQVPE